MANPSTLNVSLGIFAFNEERNIAKILDSALKQKLEHVVIKEIVVVSSGSFDRTNSIVRKYSQKDNRIKLVEQLYREGKSSAINEFINHSKTNVLIAISGDIRLHTKAIEEISLPFFHSDVGMVGAHPIPTNTQSNPVGPQVRILWKLHHLISLHSPKCGEMVAFRKVIRSIPKESAVDEATLEVLLNLIGYKIMYAPRAIVYNKGPHTINDFLKQRRRVYAGHKWLSQHYHYQVSTMKTVSTASVIRSYLVENPQDIFEVLKLLVLEFVSRVIGWFDYRILDRNPFIWDMVKRD